MNEPLADVDTTVHDGSPVIRIRGEIDMANADSVGGQLRAAAKPSDTVIVDLTAVEFFDSSALRMLQQLSADFDAAGGKLTVAVDPDGIVGRLLTITNMEAYLHIRDPLR